MHELFRAPCLSGGGVKVWNCQLFFSFAMITLVGLILVVITIVETKRRSLEEFESLSEGS